ncbi:hypothetical protein DFJ73DRAFT_761250 [Zopfochytrium polystomum]|nr:hypothetical protein DFJ73DRAFT_761250 [Zopfochytrium polystomum]
MRSLPATAPVVRAAFHCPACLTPLTRGPRRYVPYDAVKTGWRLPPCGTVCGCPFTKHSSMVIGGFGLTAEYPFGRCLRRTTSAPSGVSPEAKDVFRPRGVAAVLNALGLAFSLDAMRAPGGIVPDWIDPSERELILAGAADPAADGSSENEELWPGVLTWHGFSSEHALYCFTRSVCDDVGPIRCDTCNTMVGDTYARCCYDDLREQYDHGAYLFPWMSEERCRRLEAVLSM